MKETRASGRPGFIARDHRYVYLGGSVMAALGLLLWSRAATPYSFLPEGSAPGLVLAVICGAFLAVSAVALIIKLTHWKTYGATAIKQPGPVRISRYFSYLLAIAFALIVLDRIVLKVTYIIAVSFAAESIPEGFFPAMVYLCKRGTDILATGVWTTIRLALLGTAIAFVLALLMVFCRIQVPNKRDNDLVKFLKIVANRFSGFYVLVIRGTPMMVQSLIIYYAGFNLMRAVRPDLSITEINRIWTAFLSGLITVSLNSTAYITEVLRGGIMAIDRGQAEAARSLGMSEWMAMVKVVFPQAVKNSIPAIGNEFIINIKDSSVLSVISVMDLMFATKTVAGIYYRGLEVYCVAAVVYLILTYLSSVLLNFLASRMNGSSGARSDKSKIFVPDIPSSN